MAHRRSQPRSIALVAGALGVVAAGTAVVASAGGEPARVARGLLLVALLAPVCWIDLRRRLIPNRLTAAGALAAVTLTLATAPQELPAALAWAVGAGGFLLLPALARPEAMGMGDVKLAAVLGLLLGPAVVTALLAGLVAASLAGGALLLRDLAAARRVAPGSAAAALRAARTATLPLGPFLAFGAAVAFVVA
jgi:leader peptidase (prepilin peptidase)/N-methyltransferase